MYFITFTSPKKKKFNKHIHPRVLIEKLINKKYPFALWTFTF